AVFVAFFRVLGHRGPANRQRDRAARREECSPRQDARSGDPGGRRTSSPQLTTSPVPFERYTSTDPSDRGPLGTRTRMYACMPAASSATSTSIRGLGFSHTTTPTALEGSRGLEVLPARSAGTAPAHRPLDEVERGLRDLAPSAVDREGVAAIRDL